MENLYIFIVAVLFLLAFSDLIVGVSNDAVNFLNSAIGAKAGSFKLIMFIAALGVFVGATFSGGMMEVARKGIMNPQQFYFSEIMVIYLAVMLTDIILLDGFNTLGMPTSTTVSIVFELLGAAVAISLLKIYNEPDALKLAEYINTSKALAIISGILLSVVVAFTVGAVVQYITRLIFTFNYDKKIKRFGGIYGGLAITAITYFMILKGAKGATFMTSEATDWLKEHTLLILLYSFIGWTVFIQLLNWIFKVNILKVIVFAGTFALAMAFAGNDLVNFIGVPLAGFEAFQNFKAAVLAGNATPDTYLMTSLAGKVKTDTYMLVIAGLVMVVTLWSSKKAKSVVKTSLDLSRQGAGEERFGSSMLGRTIVRFSNNTSLSLGKLSNDKTKKWFESRFDQTNYNERIAKEKNPPSFDLIRASVNLVVASILIALATSLKLPLSTTYVTFMVAMGTSLSDKAWGRESAVFRVTGVLSVIGGWFLTALIAFSVAFLMALFIKWAGIYGIVIIICFAAVTLYRTQISYKKREEKRAKAIEEAAKAASETKNDMAKKSIAEVNGIIKKLSAVYSNSIEAFIEENRRNLRKYKTDLHKLKKDAYIINQEGLQRLKLFAGESDDVGLSYIQVLNAMNEFIVTAERIVNPLFDHVDNSHKVFSEIQKEEISELTKMMENYIGHCRRLINTEDYEKIPSLIPEKDNILLTIKKFSKNQAKRLKGGSAGVKIGILYLDLLHESKTFVLDALEMINAQREFLEEFKKLN